MISREEFVGVGGVEYTSNVYVRQMVLRSTFQRMEFVMNWQFLVHMNKMKCQSEWTGHLSKLPLLPCVSRLRLFLQPRIYEIKATPKRLLERRLEKSGQARSRIWHTCDVLGALPTLTWQSKRGESYIPNRNPLRCSDMGIVSKTSDFMIMIENEWFAAKMTNPRTGINQKSMNTQVG